MYEEFETLRKKVLSDWLNGIIRIFAFWAMITLLILILVGVNDLNKNIIRLTDCINHSTKSEPFLEQLDIQAEIERKSKDVPKHTRMAFDEIRHETEY